MSYAQNNLEHILRDKMETMKSRYVKRVEWCINGATDILMTHPEGRALESRVFSMAGVDNLQLVVFPSGASSTQEGNCSYFINAPGGTYLKGNLVMGPSVKPVMHTWQQRGTFGRANFGLFSSFIDPVTDSMVIALEITEAYAHRADRSADALEMRQMIPGGALTDVMQLPSTLPQLNPNQRGLANTMRSTGFKGPSAGVPQDLSFQKELSQTLGARQKKRDKSWKSSAPPAPTMLPPTPDPNGFGRSMDRPTDKSDEKLRASKGQR
jgi:hypothetical protein